MRSQQHLLRENRPTSGTEIGDPEVRVLNRSGTAAIAATARVFGSFKTGDVLRATVDTNTTSPTVFTYTAVATSTAQVMAAGLAALINASANIDASAAAEVISALAAGGDTTVTIDAASITRA